MAAEALLGSCPQGSAIHHIGSTAIPGLAGKDVIDIQISVASLAHFDPGALIAAGYLNRGEMLDHMPAGVPVSSSELAKRYFVSTEPFIHVHVRERGRFNQRFALLCRDYLRANRPAAVAYEAVKRMLAAQLPNDKSAYYAVKDPVSDLILAGAEEWAARTGWIVPED